MKKKKIKPINLTINRKKIILKNNCINSISKSNISTAYYSSIKKNKNSKTIEPYEDINNKFVSNFNGLNSPQNMSNSSQNRLLISFKHINTEERNEIENTTDINFNNIMHPQKSFVYKRKNINLNYNNNISRKNNILLNDYRKRVMKLFLSSFRTYILTFLRKHFYSFIRNITFLIMKKELFYKSNEKIKTKKVKMNRCNNYRLNRSYDNVKQLNNEKYRNKEYIENTNKNKYIGINPLTDMRKDKENYKYKFIHLSRNNQSVLIDQNNNRYNNNSPNYTNIINSHGKFYEYKNIFISLDNKTNKYANKNYKQYECFSKKIKDIITIDKRMFIRINYIFFIPKKQRRCRNISEKHLLKINNSLNISQIYSFEYLSNKSDNILNQKEKLAIIPRDEEKIKNIFDIIDNIYILKEKRLLIYILKVIKLVMNINKIIKMNIFRKIGLTTKDERKLSSGIFLLDDKMIFSTDNFDNLKAEKDN